MNTLFVNVHRILLLAVLGLGVPARSETNPAVADQGVARIVARTTHPSGVYKVDEQITLQIKVFDSVLDPVDQVEYSVKLHDARVIAAGKLAITNHAGVIQTSLPEPGSLLFTLAGTTAKGEKVIAYAGAVAAAKKIQWPLRVPDDFDAFWDEKVAESKKLPLNPKVEAVAIPNEPAIEYDKVTLDNIHGSHVYGQLARPKRPGKYPAILLVQYAGVYPLKRESVTGYARDGWLALNISAHDVPFDLPEKEFAKLADTTLKDYTAIGETNRETSYFLRMFLGCQRAAEYLTTRDDWNGRILVVRGKSQGGLQSIVTAALNPKVSALMALMPAGCGNTAKQIGRGWGWPYWQAHAVGPEAARIMETSRYFDAINFAHRVRCPALLGPGLMETTCPASNVLALGNLLGGPVEVVVLPEAGHQAPQGDVHGEIPFSSRATVWLKDLQAGRAFSAIIKNHADWTTEF